MNNLLGVIFVDDKGEWEIELEELEKDFIFGCSFDFWDEDF